MESATAIDKNGRTIHLGDSVRIIDLKMDLFHYLDPVEIEDIRSMLGEILPVERIESNGFVTVTKWFNRGSGKHESHTLSLSQAQVELAG